jgi:hypothetical protein
MNDDPHHLLLFGVRRSVRYHDRRSAHFDWLHRITNLVTIFLSGIVLLEIAGDCPLIWVKILGGAGAILGATDLVVGFSRCANAHRDFKRRFIELEIELSVAGADVDKIRQKRLAIEAEEPTPYRALDLLCHNELCRAMGYNRQEDAAHFYTVPWWVRLTAQWFRWEDIADSLKLGS